MKIVLNSVCAVILILFFFLIYACGGIATQKNDTKNDAKIEKVRADLSALIQAGRDMEPLRASSSGCEEKMNELNNEAMRIVKEISNMSEHLALRMAAIEIYNCISCSSDALAACDETEKILADPKNYSY